MAIVATDFGGTEIKIGVVENGRVIVSTTVNASAADTIENNLINTTRHIRSFLKKQNIKESGIEGFGMALPVIVDGEKNTVITEYVKYRDAKGFDFDKWFRENWDIPLQLENDARAALLGEWQYGAGKGSNDLVMLTLGTGVGSAVLTGGKLLRGKHNLAGNMIGHTILNFDGVDCNCGSVGCLETEAATWALPAIAKRIKSAHQSTLRRKTDLSFKDLALAIEQGDLFAKDVFDHCIKAWGMCAANLVHSFDPEKIIVGGGVMKSASKILPAMQEYVNKHTWLPANSVKIVAAQQSAHAALLGMDFLLKQRIKKNL